MAGGLLDALEEYRTNFNDFAGSMRPDGTNTGDMLALLASRGLFPKQMAQIDSADNHADQDDVQYMHTEWADNARWPLENTLPTIPKEQWMGEWQKAGKRYADYQRMMEEDGW